MNLKFLHDWNLSPQAAIRLQRQLAARVRLTKPARKRWRLIAGADVAIDGAAGEVVCAIVVMNSPAWDVVEEVTARAPLSFPYVPGLLSFREAPVLLAAFGKLRTRPHAVICDGQGIAHPRSLGLASHLGLWLNLPTIGSAKSRLVGEAQGTLAAARGSRVPLIYQGKCVGSVLRTRAGVRPLWVSPGHRIDIDTAADLILRCCTRYRLPEPQRAADRLANLTKRRD